MQNNFSELGISDEILKAIGEMGFIEPTQVQSQTIPSILNHEDVIVMSKTGSGKTAVFGIPMLMMTSPDATGPQGLILTPTRELAVQVDDDLKKMGKYLSHKTAVVYGQHSMNTELQALRKGVSIVTGTPGRVYDHLRQGNLVTKDIKFLVLDEADRMLDMGFLVQVVRIIKTLPRNRVTLLFSATIPSEIQRISRDFMNNPVMIEIESETMTVDSIKQIYYRLNRNEKQTLLNRILLYEQPDSCMIFCNTRIAVDHVQTFLTRKGYFAQSLHGDIPQSKRMKTIEQFREGVFHILVATDVAARGIHIDSLSLVLNYDVPLEKDGYVHRIGRTGRAGNEGLAITMVTNDDIMSLYAIEEHTGSMIEEGYLPTDEMLQERKESSDNWIIVNAIKESVNPVAKTAVRKKSENLAKPTKKLSEKPITQKPAQPKIEPAKSSQAGYSNKPNNNPIDKKQPSPMVNAAKSSPIVHQKPKPHFRTFGGGNEETIRDTSSARNVGTDGNANPNPNPNNRTVTKSQTNSSVNDKKVADPNNPSVEVPQTPETPHFLKRIFQNIFK